MDFQKRSIRWNVLRHACEQHSASGRWLEGQPGPINLHVAPPATADQIRQVENELGIAIPASFREALSKYSASIDVAWSLPNGCDPPQPFHQIGWGTCLWDLSKLTYLQSSHRDWVSASFGNASDPYDAVWHNKFAFTEVGNGDMLAIELGLGDRQPVVYLSHDGGVGHGYLLGDDFCDFIDRHTQLGCPGYEDWQWLPFVSSPTSYLEPNGQNAVSWKKWFGLDGRSV